MFKNSTKTSTKDVVNSGVDLFDSFFYDLFSNTDVRGSSAPYDVSVKDNVYRIDVALAGFTKEQITVKVLQDKILQILATAKETDERSGSGFIHKKLSFTTKELQFNIQKNSEIHDVKFENGLLTVKVTPPNKSLENKPNEKLIAIN